MLGHPTNNCTLKPCHVSTCSVQQEPILSAHYLISVCYYILAGKNEKQLGYIATSCQSFTHTKFSGADISMKVYICVKKGTKDSDFFNKDGYKDGYLSPYVFPHSFSVIPMGKAI